MDFITVDDALRLHDQLVERFGGACGVRDFRLLDSAVAQAQSMAFGQYLHEGMYEMAAAYCFHIIKNHPFLDGNKRTGLLVAMTFLQRNGLIVHVEFDVLYEVAISVATSKISKKELASLFESFTAGDPF